MDRHPLPVSNTIIIAILTVFSSIPSVAPEATATMHPYSSADNHHYHHFRGLELYINSPKRCSRILETCSLKHIFQIYLQRQASPRMSARDLNTLRKHGQAAYDVHLRFSKTAQAVAHASRSFSEHALRQLLASCPSSHSRQYGTSQPSGDAGSTCRRA